MTDTRTSAPESTESTETTSGGHGGRGLAALALTALGVVFGDIGTSPLYALRTVFTIDNGAVRPTPDDVYGVISVMFWSVTVVVSIKYVTILMRADNNGEGGVMALAALARRLFAKRSGRVGVFILIGIIGVALFYGDSIITPAVSVLSAVEGLEVAAPGVAHLVVPIAGVILAGLFAVQRFGTGRVGTLFGPIMLLWFLVLAVAGVGMIVRDPSVLIGLSPTYAFAFVFAHPTITFVAMGAVVLVITGAEALYADMGHFGAPPIRRAWFFVVFPALTLNYLGQASLILRDPTARQNPFFLLFPDWARIPVVVLATAATVIASQAVISGAFSLSRQAMQLGLLPPLTVRQTSEREGGQIYLPAVNALLFVGVIAVMLAFRSSERLATAYGVSVTGALVVDSVLLLIVARPLFNWHRWQIVLAAVVFGGLELTFLAANLSKVLHGGWVPLLIAAAVITVMTTWRRGRQLVTDERNQKEGSLADFIDRVRSEDPPRVDGIAVFPHPNKDTTPLALRANFEHNHVLHHHVLIVSVQTANVPHVPASKAYTFDDLGYSDDGIEHLTIKFGFSDEPNLPVALRRACVADVLSLDPDAVERASYFVSRGALRTGHGRGMMRWRKKLFVALAQNAANPSARFGLPSNSTVTMGSDVDV
ncbi:MULTISPECIES: potassium transporter Kup [unclassified Curtobacterium]|uniref:potassium transporter Kup n=1 Tax=unclassified Curtobacterium TaxID=257496 RepID=UPI000DA931F9|nr:MULTISPECIES: potassium transporter Kup [unclassified Curtobacterium]PZE29870.1 potassium transporter Kup [Curtobacterium sp. MCBD17_028]PZF60912.1 potassium transporter Kup [Curtobacterium sp. MCBD17_034]PZF66351.1 potassium transporter Kup [Curtobacterium sp. MCBD17_013]PZM40261.1 potassium transporter Kup [Curtobacterium sp. MCBD17_031]WIB64919.1 potassium transporter Kup [Curtobacterium sp. MCBD17_040]